MKAKLSLSLALSLLMCGSVAVAQAASKPVEASRKPVDATPKPIAPFTVLQLRAGNTVETEVTPAQLNPSGYWLMLYIDPASKASRALLDHLQRLASVPPATPQGPAPKPKVDASKLVIIAGRSTGAELSQFELLYPGLEAAAWTHDIHAAAAHLLDIHGTPHIFGMREGMLHWQLAANLKSADIEPALTTWAGFNSLPKNKLTRIKHTPPLPSTPQSPPQ